MAYTKNIWTDGANGGTPITAARLQNIENGIGAAYADFAVAFLRANAAQTGLSNTASVQLNLQVADIDTHAGFTANRWTVPAGQAGIYAVEGGITVQSVAGQYMNAQIFKNGTGTPSAWGNVLSMGTTGGAAGVTTGRKLLTLAVGDYLTLCGYSGTASWSTFVDTISGPWLSIERIR